MSAAAPIPPSNEVIDVEAFVLTPLSRKGTTKSTAISVEQYALDKDLELAIAASLGLPSPASAAAAAINLSDDENDDVTILASKPESAPFGKRRKFRERGEPSSSAPFVCEICTETKTVKESFGVAGCAHYYCTECVVMYVGSKLEENVIEIRCPAADCGGFLFAEGCREILPKDVFDRWGSALCEAVIGSDERFYCPFKDCSALMVDDGGELVRQSECPNCRRLFCAQCRVPWHGGIGCEEFQRLNEDEREKEDIMLMKLAETKMWRRCPNCRFYVEKSEGCMYMKCRCGNAFCYNCGAPPKDQTHYCYSCRR